MTQPRFRLFIRVSVIVVVLLVSGLARQSFAATTTYVCKSVEVMTYDVRVHVRCDKAAAGGIVFFAASTANSQHAARILSVLLMAHTTARPIAIQYDPSDTSGSDFGCAVTDCRRLLAVGVQ
jgi:hypothetical protein